VGLALSQHVAGLGITMLATALSTTATAWPSQGQHAAHHHALPPMDWLPMPVLGEETALTLLALLLVPLMAWCCTARRSGLAVRMVGENPQAAEGQGIPVRAVRTAAIVAGSALMGVAGAFLTLSAFNAFFFNMVNGRGWICVALVVFASWRPGKACWARCCSPSSTRCSCACSRRAKPAALPGLPDAALCPVHPGPGAGGAPCAYPRP
jgi:simple sugar transport system permease protein